MSPPGPPKPPPRRPPAPPAAEQPANPFMVPEPTPQAPAPQPESSANPFLAPEPTPAPAPSAQTPRVIPPSQGAPLQARPGVEAPHIRDAHAEFRKGSWKKPLLIGVIAAAVAGGLFFGIPEPEEPKPSPFADESGPPTVIGASVSPQVIEDPDKPSLTNPTPQRKEKPAEEEQPTSQDRPDRSDGFANAFKSSAK